jgi:hypothetical protein
VTRVCGNRQTYAVCDRTRLVQGMSRLLLNSMVAIITFLVSSTPPVAAATRASQHFVCSAGYTRQECQLAADVFSKALAGYPLDALGEWRWVLVRTEDWKQILTMRRIDPNCPAFSVLPQRETFLDGSLVSGVTPRSVELRMQWHMTIADLLDLAIRHELAHALCNEYDESKAQREASDLKNKRPLSCRMVQRASATNANNQAHMR